jgi:hypothetical protein
MTESEAKDVAEELAAMDLETRRAYLADVEQNQGKESADLIRAALKALWDNR